jgi:DNA-binding MarR family transcriptional regulator/GNAT superfamily N-acetyltransferase
MDESTIRQVRRFNRVVAQRVGALHDHYLGRDRPLGEARVLWEIGDGGCDVRSLRERLDLDSGYLSRLLRSLESAGLVAVGPSPGDGRVRTARLTPAGAAERALLDQRSDELARSFLSPLDRGRRDRLVAAMGEVERLLTAALVEVREVDPGEPDAQHCLNKYFAEIDRRFTAGFDPALSTAPDVTGFRPPTGLFLVASLRGEPVGCGGLRFDEPGESDELGASGEPGDKTADVKRMWVADSVRGLGLGRRLLAELEARAAAHGARVVRLETNKALDEAKALYRSAGYREVEPFNDEAYADHWFEKRLEGAPGEIASGSAGGRT